MKPLWKGTAAGRDRVEYPHAVVPSLLSDEGKRIVLPAFFQRGRDLPDRTRQTLATAHHSGPKHRCAFASVLPWLPAPAGRDGQFTRGAEPPGFSSRYSSSTAPS